ncbi:uncharacterized protein LOC132269931 [Cornus florida]|uniref:uncharacterized protein LOC132269931 n=1 Tax=Cornus florida TaxID=4283 RepID=UPI00289C0414|nr:uncharacterized protein LOC132269931 [Cornus florida]
MVNDITRDLWTDRGLLRITSSEKGLFEFHFSSTEQCDNVLADGPWFFANKPLILHHWMQGFQKSLHSTIPIWIKLFGIPRQFWTEQGLSFITSSIGHPLFADLITEGGLKTRFAKVCVTVNANSDFPSTLKLHMSNGQVANINVLYLNCPPSSSSCNVFGHTRKTCLKSPAASRPSQPRNEWQIIPMKKPSTTHHHSAPLISSPPASPLHLPSHHGKNVITHYFKPNETFKVDLNPYKPEHLGTSFISSTEPLSLDTPPSRIQCSISSHPFQL